MEAEKRRKGGRRRREGEKEEKEGEGEKEEKDMSTRRMGRGSRKREWKRVRGGTLSSPLCPQIHHKLSLLDSLQWS